MAKSKISSFPPAVMRASKRRAARGEPEPGRDLRGARFDGASLAGADFVGVRTGMPRRWQAIAAIGGLLIAVGLGVVTGFGGRWLKSLLESDDPRRVALALYADSALLIYIIAALWKGAGEATRTVLPVIAALMVATAVISVATGVGTGAGAIAVLGVLLIGVALVALGALARAVAGTAATALFILVAVSGGAAGGLVGGGVVAVVIAVSAALIGRRALKEGGEYPLLTKLTVAFACWHGTSFRGADLTGADFSRARLVACDFRGAKLEGTRFDGATFHLCLFEGGRPRPPSEGRPDSERPAPSA